MSGEYILGDRVVQQGELQALFPNVSLPVQLDADSLEALGLEPVQAVAAPAAGPNQAAERNGVEQVGGVWRQRWKLRELSPAEMAQSAAFLRGSLLQQATSLRWERETGGVTLPGGIRVGTTAADQARITSVIAIAQLGGVDPVDFKAESGWATLTLDQVRGIAGAIARHVQACFSAERRHHEAIVGLADADLASYDVTTGWP